MTKPINEPPQAHTSRGRTTEARNAGMGGQGPASGSPDKVIQTKPKD